MRVNRSWAWAAATGGPGEKGPLMCGSRDSWGALCPAATTCPASWSPHARGPAEWDGCSLGPAVRELTGQGQVSLSPGATGKWFPSRREPSGHMGVGES